MNLDKIVAAIRKLIHYIEERIVLRNLVLAFLILFFGTAIIMQILKIYTRHNHDLTVPDFAGMTISEATRVAEERNFRTQVFDSVFLADLEKGTVVEQHPKAGLAVKKNRIIFLTMNAMNPEKVAMPDLVDLTFRQASAKLESFGLKVGRITYEPNIATSMVLAQHQRGHTLAPGDTVVKGASIDLVLGKGLSDQVADVPSLIGYRLEDAKITASDRFLSVGAAVHDNTIVVPEDENNAIIFRQKPEGGTLPLGSAIDVWVTLDSTKVPRVMIANDTIGIP